MQNDHDKKYNACCTFYTLYHGIILCIIKIIRLVDWIPPMIRFQQKNVPLLLLLFSAGMIKR